MIEPEDVSPVQLIERLKSNVPGPFFCHFDQAKYIFYDNNVCIFEIMPSHGIYVEQGYYLNRDGKYQSTEDFFSFLAHLGSEYPDVADWFLFNIKKFT